MQRGREGSARGALENTPVGRFLFTLARFEKPVVVAVTGDAVGVGVGVTMLLHSDLVYVSDEARLMMPFVSLGLVPEFASSLLVPQLMGGRRAAEKLLHCEPITAEQAVDFGIANAVIAVGEVVNHARRMAERFNGLQPAVVREAKRLMRAPQRALIEETIRTEARIFGARLKSPEAMEAMAAFFQKRKPNFSKF